jgi:hypothetical protein
MSVLRRTADAQASLQSQFDRHKFEPLNSSQAAARVAADALLRQEPDQDGDDDRNDDDDDEGDGYSE